MAQESCTSTDIDSVDAEIQTLIDGFISAMAVVPDLEDAESVERRETDLRDRLGALSAKVLERDIQAAIDSERIRKDERELIKGWPKKLKNRGVREVTLQTSWGIAITIRVRYYSGNGKKAKGKGMYPALRLLGIYDRCTPVAGSEVARTLAALSSIEEARNELQQRGIRLSVNAIRRIAYQWAERVRQRLGHEAVQLADKPGKRRVVVSSDGGRVRIRRNKKGQKTKKGRSRYHTDWKEPKLLIIYTVDERGRREKQFSPYIDGTMKGPDVLYGYIRFYLRKLEITQAESVVFVSDGAPWIWDRIPGLMMDLGLNPKRVFPVLDFYHAVEHLAKVTQLRKRWTAKERKSWLTKHRRMLKQGEVEAVIKQIRSLCRGGNKAIRTELNYFIKHKAHMAYDKLKALGLPIGSGAIESAIRRVLNLRIKGPAIYWKEESAEAIILLRSYFKAGRWNTLKNIALAPTIKVVA
jgi:hypothetical protein